MIIPKILHYVWIGPYNHPRVSFYNSWIECMPEYKIKKWTNDIPELRNYLREVVHLFGGVRNLTGYAMTYVCDVLRLLILRDHGGIYMDHDIVVLKDLTPLIDKHSLVLTYQHDPDDYDKNIILPPGTKMLDMLKIGYENIQYEDLSTLNNCFIAVTPNHPFIHSCIEMTIENHYRVSSEQIPMSDWTVGPYVFTSVLDSEGHPVKRALPIDKGEVRVYQRSLLHPIRGSQRLAMGAPAYEEMFKRMIAEKAAYAIHYHEHFGAEMYLNKKIITFADWYASYDKSQ